MTQTPNFHLNQWSPEDYVRRTDFNADNAKIDAALEAAGNCRIVTGSYTGTGHYNSATPNSLTFEKAPLLLLIFSDAYFFAAHGNARGQAVAENGGWTLPLTWTEQSVSWFSRDSANAQLNDKDVVYSYIAFLSAT